MYYSSELVGRRTYLVFCPGAQRAVVGGRRRADAFFPLSTIAEPDPHHLLLEAESVSDSRDVERGRLRLGEEMSFERVLSADSNRRPSLAASFGGLFLFTLRPSGLFSLFQPLFQNGLQLLGILEAQLKILKPADGGLTKVCPLHVGQGLAHVGLREAQLDAPLLETGGKLF